MTASLIVTGHEPHVLKWYRFYFHPLLEPTPPPPNPSIFPAVLRLLGYCYLPKIENIE